MRNIYDLNPRELEDYFVSIDEPKYRAAQVFGELHKGKVIADIPTLPKALRLRLEEKFHTKLPTIVTEQKSKDGTRKFLLEFGTVADRAGGTEGTRLVCGTRKSVEFDHLGVAQTVLDFASVPLVPPALSAKSPAHVECVLMSQDYGNTVCVSTQVGCRMGCRFCASGASGFVRNLTAGEILAQVLVASSEKKVSNIVLMGSGEPLDNFENVARFLCLVTHPGGLNIGARGISLSTVGLPDGIRAFADLGLGVNLCISLHASNDSVRQRIIPMARTHSIADIMAAVRYFFEKTGRRVIFEYILIDSVNCLPEHAGELAKLLRGFPNHINLINLNHTGRTLEDGTALAPPSKAVAMRFMDALIKQGASCTMRKSRGDDIDAACGQLRLRHTTKV